MNLVLTKIKNYSIPFFYGNESFLVDKIKEENKTGRLIIVKIPLRREST